MRDIVIIAPAGYGISSIQERLPESATSIVGDQSKRLTVTITGASDPIEFIIDDSVAEFYEDDELEAISAAGDSPSFILVHFKDIEGLKDLLTSVANRTDILIDNDFGLIEDGVSFSRRCQAQPGWDWAS